MNKHRWFYLCDKYIQIRRLEVYINRPFNFDRFNGGCGCKFLELGWLGLTWLSDECL